MVGFRIGVDGIDRNAELIAQHLDLLDRGRPLQVGGDQQRLTGVLVAQEERELARGRRLAATLQPAQHDDRGPVLGEVEAGIDRSHEGDQLVVDVADDLLAGVDRAQHFLADRFLGDALDEDVGDIVVDVGVEQGAADLHQALADVGLGDPAAAAQLLQRFGQISLDAFEHGFSLLARRQGNACSLHCPAVGRWNPHYRIRRTQSQRRWLAAAQHP